MENLKSIFYKMRERERERERDSEFMCGFGCVFTRTMLMWIIIHKNKTL
jgi:hypothetical protein